MEGRRIRVVWPSSSFVGAHMSRQTMHSVAHYFAHGLSAGPQPFLLSHLTLLLAVLLVTSVGCQKALSSPLANPKHTHQQQEQQEIKKSGSEDASAITDLSREDSVAIVGEERVVGKAEEEAEADPQRRQVNKGGSIMAAAARPFTAPKSWPNLVGLDAEEAKKKILEEHPNFVVHIVPEGSFQTMDLNLRRVRILTNKEKKVAKAPQQG